MLVAKGLFGKPEKRREKRWWNGKWSKSRSQDSAVNLTLSLLHSFTFHHTNSSSFIHRPHRQQSIPSHSPITSHNTSIHHVSPYTIPEFQQPAGSPNLRMLVLSNQLDRFLSPPLPSRRWSLREGGPYPYPRLRDSGIWLLRKQAHWRKPLLLLSMPCPVSSGLLPLPSRWAQPLLLVLAESIWVPRCSSRLLHWVLWVPWLGLCPLLSFFPYCCQPTIWVMVWGLEGQFTQFEGEDIGDDSYVSFVL